MRLLIVTQTVDLDDLYLSFFHTWLLEFAKRFESISVICLREGRHELPANVSVYSLGKETGSGRFMYIARFFTYLWKLRFRYDAVLVHMNQEYVLLAGWWWYLQGIPAYMWRNHYSGNRLTDIAAAFCRKVFCTSRFSYTAKYAKTVFMPVGIDTAVYRALAHIERRPRSILFYGRLSPSKHPETLIEALGILKEKGIGFAADIRGTALPKDAAFERALHERVRELGLSECVRFVPGLPFSEGPAIFSASEIYVNLAASGMYDKMLFEAAACGCIVLASSADYAALVDDSSLVFPTADAQSLADRLQYALSLTHAERETLGHRLRYLTEDHHGLATLGKELEKQLSDGAAHPA